jgi:general stress protein YciG
MPRGASPKRERQYKHIEQSAKKSGRYGGRAEEVAARTVNKIRREKGETKSQRAGSTKSSSRASSSRSRAAKSRATKSRSTRSRTRAHRTSPSRSSRASKSPARTGRSRRASNKGRGFAGMSDQRQRQIAAAGGRAAHSQGTAHEFSAAEARKAGQKGGEAVSRNRRHMAEIGRRGGER